MKNYLILLILWISGLTLLAEIINIPADFTTIQNGINSAVDGDTVLVAEGEYLENINFNGKNIVVGSEFILDGDLTHIGNTIINGSQPSDPNIASCVSLINGENANAVLQGFTLREGLGYAYTMGSNIFREGGGIILDYSDATIKNNLIIENESLGIGNEQGGGGGGIAAWYGNPTISNNVIMNNTASYAAGLVLNYSGGIIRNNIIYANFGAEDFGAGGVMLWDCPNDTGILENNTIIANISELTAGGILVYSTTGIIRNNVVWGNIQDSGAQVTGISNSLFEYNNCEEQYSGTGNISVPPDFAGSELMVSEFSGCIDAGSPDVVFDDLEDQDNPGFALFPSLGILRNDTGAYGGPFAMEFPEFSLEKVLFPSEITFPNTNLNDSSTVNIEITNYSTYGMEIVYTETDNPAEIFFTHIPGEIINPINSAEIQLEWIPLEAGEMNAELSIFHNFDSIQNPLIIELSGTAIDQTDADEIITHDLILHQNYPNPFNPSTIISF